MTRPNSNLSVESDHYPLPIFLFLSVLLIVAYVGALLTGAGLPGLLPVGGIIGLMVTHLLLHWHSPRMAEHARPWMQYALAQGGLGIALTLMTGNPSVWAVIFSWLIGEAVGLLHRPHLNAISLVLYGLLGSAALFATTDSASALEWLGAMLPTVMFVGLVVVLYKRQVEAREQAHQLVTKLEAANQQIAAYAERVEDLTLTNERQRMARELHDTLSQDVAGLVLQLEAVNAHLDAGRTAKAQAIVRQAMARARSTLHAARAVIDDLRERDGGTRLSDRLEVLCRRFAVECEVECEVTIEMGVSDAALPIAQQEHLERIVSEVLTNIRRHAKATHVTVQVRADVGTLTLRVEDNGVGFDATQVPHTGRYGLRGLRERARLLGGTLRIQSVRGEGTTITLEMPVVSSSILEIPKAVKPQAMYEEQ